MQSQISLEIIERLRVSTVRTILAGTKALGAKRGPRRVCGTPTYGSARKAHHHNKTTWDHHSKKLLLLLPTTLTPPSITKKKKEKKKK